MERGGSHRTRDARPQCARAGVRRSRLQLASLTLGDDEDRDLMRRVERWVHWRVVASPPYSTGAGSGQVARSAPRQGVGWGMDDASGCLGRLGRLIGALATALAILAFFRIQTYDDLLARTAPLAPYVTAFANTVGELNPWPTALVVLVVVGLIRALCYQMTGGSFDWIVTALICLPIGLFWVYAYLNRIEWWGYVLFGLCLIGFIFIPAEE